MPEEEREPNKPSSVVSGIDPEHEGKAPKRVIRTYQQDLANASGNVQSSQTAQQNPKDKEVSKEKAPNPKTSSAEELPENLPGAGDQIKNMKLPPTKESVEQKTKPAPKSGPKPLSPEERGTMHSIEELHVASARSVPKRKPGLEDTYIPPTPKPEPKPTPEPMQEPVIIEEESEQQGGFMEWLREFFGITSPQKDTEYEPRILEEHETGKHVEEKPMPAPKPESISQSEAKKPEPLPEALQQPIPPAPKPPSLPTQAPVPEPVPAPKPKPTPPAPKPAAAPIPRAPRPVSEIPKEKPAPKPAPLPKPEKPAPPKRDAESPLHTYTTDANRKGRTQSRLELIAAEQDAGRAPRVEQKRQVPIVLISIVLFILGAGLLLGAFLMLRSPEPVVDAPPRVVTPAYSDERVRVVTTDVPTISQLAPLLREVPNPGEDAFVHITIDAGSLISLNTIFTATNGVPGTLSRTILPQSMFGLYGEDGEPAFLLVVTSYERALKGMLAWERTLLDTVEPLYGDIATVPVTVGTTTPESTDPIVPSFTDRILGDFDVRMVEDANGLSYVLYGFVRPDVLLITQTPEAFAELARRILAE